MKYTAHGYQKKATERILRQKRVGLFLDMGLGKTVITLTAIKELIEDFAIWKVLVIAPKRVAEDTWSREHEKWDHLSGLRISKVLGTPAQRMKALKAEADIYVIGRDNNGLMDLWAEIYLLDRGERLGTTISAYREKYFRAGARNGYIVYKWEPYSYSQKEIERKISDICMSMSAEDYLELPERMDNEIKIRLSPKEMKQYDQMEREQLLRIDDEAVVALNAAAVMNKLLQMANGSVYADGGDVVKIHEKKLDALEEIIDTTGEPVLVFYSFRHAEDIARWNRGEIPVLLCHPASVGYGLNLQDGGHVIVWYGLTWSLELYQQANARLYRQGQQKAVIIHHLIAEGTVDEQVMRALQHKDTSQSALLAALKERANV